jgi:hypothetical protein
LTTPLQLDAYCGNECFSAWCGLRRARIWAIAAFHIQLMTDPFAPLSEEELEELDHFLLFDVDTEEGKRSGAGAGRIWRR